MITMQQFENFKEWHERRMQEQGFPEKVKEEFRRSRLKFFRIKKQPVEAKEVR